MELNSALEKAKIADSHPDRTHCEELISYISNTEKDLERLCELVEPSKPVVAQGAPAVSPDALLNSVSQIGNNPIKISVECPEFHGNEND